MKIQNYSKLIADIKLLKEGAKEDYYKSNHNSRFRKFVGIDKSDEQIEAEKDKEDFEKTNSLFSKYSLKELETKLKELNSKLEELEASEKPLRETDKVKYEETINQVKNIRREIDVYDAAIDRKNKAAETGIETPVKNDETGEITYEFKPKKDTYDNYVSDTKRRIKEIEDELNDNSLFKQKRAEELNKKFGENNMLNPSERRVKELNKELEHLKTLDNDFNTKASEDAKKGRDDNKELERRTADLKTKKNKVGGEKSDEEILVDLVRNSEAQKIQVDKIEESKARLLKIYINRIIGGYVGKVNFTNYDKSVYNAINELANKKLINPSESLSYNYAKLARPCEVRDKIKYLHLIAEEISKTAPEAAKSIENFKIKYITQTYGFKFITELLPGLNYTPQNLDDEKINTILNVDESIQKAERGIMYLGNGPYSLGSLFPSLNQLIDILKKYKEAATDKVKESIEKFDYVVGREGVPVTGGDVFNASEHKGRIIKNLEKVGPNGRTYGVEAYREYLQTLISISKGEKRIALSDDVPLDELDALKKNAEIANGAKQADIDKYNDAKIINEFNSLINIEAAKEMIYQIKENKALAQGKSLSTKGQFGKEYDDAIYNASMNAEKNLEYFAENIREKNKRQSASNKASYILRTVFNQTFAKKVIEVDDKKANKKLEKVLKDINYIKDRNVEIKSDSYINASRAILKFINNCVVPFTDKFNAGEVADDEFNNAITKANQCLKEYLAVVPEIPYAKEFKIASMGSEDRIPSIKKQYDSVLKGEQFAKANNEFERYFSNRLTPSSDEKNSLNMYTMIDVDEKLGLKNKYYDSHRFNYLFVCAYKDICDFINFLRKCKGEGYTSKPISNDIKENLDVFRKKFVIFDSAFNDFAHKAGSDKSERTYAKNITNSLDFSELDKGTQDFTNKLLKIFNSIESSFIKTMENEAEAIAKDYEYLKDMNIDENPKEYRRASNEEIEKIEACERKLFAKLAVAQGIFGGYLELGKTYFTEKTKTRGSYYQTYFFKNDEYRRKMEEATKLFAKKDFSKIEKDYGFEPGEIANIEKQTRETIKAEFGDYSKETFLQAAKKCQSEIDKLLEKYKEVLDTANHIKKIKDLLEINRDKEEGEYHDATDRMMQNVGNGTEDVENIDISKGPELIKADMNKLNNKLANSGERIFGNEDFNNVEAFKEFIGKDYDGSYKEAYNLVKDVYSYVINALNDENGPYAKEIKSLVSSGVKYPQAEASVISKKIIPNFVKERIQSELMGTILKMGQEERKQLISAVNNLATAWYDAVKNSKDSLDSGVPQSDRKSYEKVDIKTANTNSNSDSEEIQSVDDAANIYQEFSNDEIEDKLNEIDDADEETEEKIIDSFKSNKRFIGFISFLNKIYNEAGNEFDEFCNKTGLNIDDVESYLDNVANLTNTKIEDLVKETTPKSDIKSKFFKKEHLNKFENLARDLNDIKHSPNYDKYLQGSDELKTRTRNGNFASNVIKNAEIDDEEQKASLNIDKNENKVAQKKGEEAINQVLQEIKDKTGKTTFNFFNLSDKLIKNATRHGLKVETYKITTLSAQPLVRLVDLNGNYVNYASAYMAFKTKLGFNNFNMPSVKVPIGNNEWNTLATWFGDCTWFKYSDNSGKISFNSIQTISADELKKQCVEEITSSKQEKYVKPIKYKNPTVSESITSESNFSLLIESIRSLKNS